MKNQITIDKNRIRYFCSSLAAAAQLRMVQLGFLGLIFIAVGTFTPAYLPQNSPWWNYLRALALDNYPTRVIGTIITILGLFILIISWLKLRPAKLGEVKPWAVFSLWIIPLLFVPPVFSHDAYSYAAQGWLVYNGLNPYEVGPGALPGAFADQSSWIWRYTPTPYGPLAIMISAGLDWIVGFNPYYAALMQRVPSLLGAILVVVLLPKISARMSIDSRFTSWFSIMNPLFIIEFVGGCHNDAWMFGLIVLAIWLAYRDLFWLGAICLGVAAAIKQPALMAAYPIALVNYPWRTWKETPKVALRVLFSMTIAIGVFVVISLLTGLNFGWINATGVPGLVISLAPFTLIGWVLQQVFNISGISLSIFEVNLAGSGIITLFRLFGLVLLVLLLFRWALTKAPTKPMTFLSWGYLAVALCGPALQTWYLSWGGLLFPLARPGRQAIKSAVLITTVLLGFEACNLAWRNDSNPLVFAVIGLVLAVFWHTIARGVLDDLCY